MSFECSSSFALCHWVSYILSPYVKFPNHAKLPLTTISNTADTQFQRDSSSNSLLVVVEPPEIKAVASVILH